MSSKAARLSQPGAENLDRLGVLWDRHGRIVLGVAGAVAVVALVLFLNARTKGAAERSASAQLAEASVAFWQNDYQRSLDMARKVAEQYGSVPSGIEAHRLAGDDAYWMGDFKGAVAEYRRYLDKHKSGLLADAARRSLAYALESDRQFLEAAKTYEGLVGKFDRGSSAEFLFGAARCYRLAGQPNEALQRLKRLDEEFGDTFYASSARVEIGELTAQPH